MIIINILLGIGILFMIFGTIGILRFPDVYTRMHASSKCGVAGIIVLFIGLALLAIREGFTASSIKIILIAFFILITSPVASHAIARAALFEGIEPWHKSGNRE